MEKVKVYGISKNENRLILTIKKEKKSFLDFSHKILEILNINYLEEYFLDDSLNLKENLTDFEEYENLFIFTGINKSIVLFIGNEKEQNKLLSKLKQYLIFQE
jgi:hypothetical protein